MALAASSSVKGEDEQGQGGGGRGGKGEQHMLVALSLAHASSRSARYNLKHGGRIGAGRLRMRTKPCEVLYRAAAPFLARTLWCCFRGGLVCAWITVREDLIRERTPGPPYPNRAGPLAMAEQQ
eukprot:scaffold15035_cov119-Isochrysis_galbana.AAC.5